VVVRSQVVIGAITRGAHFLLAGESATRLWEKPGFAKAPWHARGGETALVTEALLDVGQSLHLPELDIYSPKMRAAINFLVKLKPTGTYTASFQANAMALLPPKKRYRMVLEEDENFLIRTIRLDGAYGYTMHFPLPPLGHPARLGGTGDNSNTQYGILGMWACAHAGLTIPGGYWRLARSHWVNTQYPNGTWVYTGTRPHPAFVPDPPPGPAGFTTMTPGGVASLFICDEYLFAQPGIRPTADRSILRGLAWMNKNFNPHEHNFYAMYGDERVALASGIQSLGGHNWYEDFAATLTKNNGGPWSGGDFVDAGANATIGTAYGIVPK
jgi:hypothetical protein